MLGQQNSGTWVNLASATTWGDLQDFAERLGAERIAMVIDKGLQNLNRRSSSAWAKKARAIFKISLARCSSLTSRSGAFKRSLSSVLTPPRTKRTARSRTSGENLLGFIFMAPFSQMLVPPQNPVRFTPSKHRKFKRPAKVTTT